MANYKKKIDLSYFNQTEIEILKAFKNKKNENVQRVNAKILTLQSLLTGILVEYRMPIDEAIGNGLWWRTFQTPKYKTWAIVLEANNQFHKLINVNTTTLVAVEPYLDKFLTYITQKIKSSSVNGLYNEGE